ncbi:MAG: metallophosphoesterase family protein [Tateyamaria sp.]|nr:serine/threonine protein phosphatase [Tateyamaria sp.]MDG0982096.1 metallophosphoesterase family protein [Tateyamaria sp.]MDG1420894.1 metallophosphoesterase family protein [Tateyamaria sp.]MDG2378986.1 metallophosphoesterase family protein [Tateyamaria sp.]
MSVPIYAIGDIHGQMQELDRVLELIKKDGGSNASVVFLGDYMDRGPDSQTVLNTLIDGQLKNNNWKFLKGNHDRMFEWFMGQPLRHDPYLMVELYWLHKRLGGNTTMASYGVDASGSRREKDVHNDALSAVPQAHIDFVAQMPLTHEKDGILFVHAGIRPMVPISNQSEEDLIWIRHEFHEYRSPHPKLIVHGHTPVNKAAHYGNRVNLDTGAGYGKPLTAAVFEAGQAWLLTENGRRTLAP